MLKQGACLSEKKIKGLVSKDNVVLRRWGVETNVWFINRVGQRKEDSRADISSVSHSLEQINELWVVSGLYSEQWSYAIGGSMITWKTRIN